MGEQAKEFFNYHVRERGTVVAIKAVSIKKQKSLGVLVARPGTS